MRENNHYTPKDSSRALESILSGFRWEQQPRAEVGSCSQHVVIGWAGVVYEHPTPGSGNRMLSVITPDSRNFSFPLQSSTPARGLLKGLIPSSATNGSWFTRTARMTDAARKAWHQALLQLSAWCHYMSSNSCTGSSVSRLNIQSGSRIAIYLCPTLIQTWSSQMK